jgi:lysozyme
MSALIDQLIRHEGVVLHPYRDTVGKLTIGVGRNLEDVGISRAEASFMLQNDVDKVITSLQKELPWIINLNPARQDVLCNMAFNMGVVGLLLWHFFLVAVSGGEFDSAANRMLGSKWARQVGSRAKELAEQMRTGQYQV